MSRRTHALSGTVFGRHDAAVRRALVVVVATVGFGLNFWAWVLMTPLSIAPALRHRPDSWILVLAIALPVSIGALGRIPVGALTDRYGARLMFPVVSVAAAVGVLALVSADSWPGLIVAACGLGVAGTAFAVGAPLVMGAYPLGRRGFALSVFGAGMGGAGVAGLTSRWLAPVESPRGLVILAMLLLGFAGLAALVLRGGHQGSARHEPIARVAAAVWRLPATRHLAAWYAMAFGGLIALALYLPVIAYGAYRLDWSPAALATAAVIGVGSIARPVGGWLCDRGDPMRILAGCFTGVAVLALVLAFRPPLIAAMAGAFGMAACLGTASGIVLALLGRTAPMDRMGIIAGTVGAAGGLASLVPLLVLATVHGVTGSYGIGLTVLAAAAMSAAVRLRRKGRWSGGALAFPGPAAPDATGTTLVVLTAGDVARNVQGVVVALAALATRRDLIIAYGDVHTSAGPTPHALVSELRSQLPSHTILAVCVDTPPRPRERELLTSLLNEGCVGVAIVPVADLDAVATVLGDQLGVDNVLFLTHDYLHGVRLGLRRTIGAVAGRP